MSGRPIGSAMRFMIAARDRSASIGTVPPHNASRLRKPSITFASVTANGPPRR